MASPSDTKEVVMARPKKSSEKYDAKGQLITAFLSLARKMPIDKITVKMVTDAVGCNKTTFYYHFETIEDLYRAAIDQAGIYETTHMVVEKVLNGDWVKGTFGPDEHTIGLLDQLCTLVYLNAGGRSRELIDTFITSSAARALGVDPETADEQMRTLLAFTSGGIYGALHYRGQMNNSIPVDEFCDAFYDMVIPAIYQKVDLLRRHK
jgi:AcrR family transcriptional regulator